MKYIKIIQRMFYVLTTALLSIYAIGSVTCDDVTDLPDIVKNDYNGAARNTYGSGTLRSTNENAFSNKIHRDKQEQITNRLHRENHGDYGVMVIHHHAPQSPITNSHKPPSYPNMRFGSKNSPMHVPSITDPIRSQFGIRREDSAYPGGIGISRDKIFSPNEDILFEEEAILDSNHQSSGTPSVECDLKCGPTEFFCSKSCSCIHSDLHCDGQIDCGPDAEDEEECEVTDEMIKKMKSECEGNTLSQHIMCPNTFICIKQDWLCDGDDDCNDFTDETHCGSKQNCSDDQFECNNGLCVPQEWMCDGDNDCRDGSDESNCTRTCTNDEFQCLDDSCISLAFKCDGEQDCEDNSDEMNCDFPLPNCPEGEFKCKGLLGGMGGPGGRCILQRFRCDGDNDCGDWSDEENCPKKSISCTSNEFKCDDGRCIPLRWKCDQEQDCDSGEDEKDCSDIGNNNRECNDDEYTCKDSRCILKSWVCDGTSDCKRGEDEADCDVKCDIGQFSCPSKVISPRERRQNYCVSQKHICDGHKDCIQGEDEENCPTIHPCPANTKCQQLCATNSVTGKEECSCKVGYVLAADGFTCNDINECEFTNNPCSQTCNNTVGSFICGCITGYVLRPDLRTCKALGGAVKLIMANRGDIRQVTLSNNQYTSIIKGLPNAIALDYHYEKDLLFWTDVSADVIKQSFINGTNVKDVIKWGLESPGGLSVDWVHELIFWTDSGTRRVEVSTYDGKLRSVLAANDLDKPRAIVVHPGKYFVFWSDWGPNAKIERAYMDGSERTAITNDGIYWPNGLALDFATDRIFWADAKHHVIENSRLDGSDRKKILSNNLPHPFALTIFEDNLFWTDWYLNTRTLIFCGTLYISICHRGSKHTKTISSANKVTGKNFRHVHEGLHFPMDIHSYHKARQPKFENRCAEDRKKLKGGCSHLCLPNKTSRRCACPIGLTLLDDQKTCTTVPDKLLILARKKDIRIKQLETRNPKEVDNNIPLDNLKSTVALDWCSRTDRIYWSDVGKSTINRAFLNGSNQETVIQDGLVSPAGLALDWITNKLYWTDAGTNRIEVASIDGHQRALLVWQNLLKPRDIVVHPLQGIMFWSDWSETPLIERAGMDGSHRTAIVSENLQYPNGITIDYANNRLYFVDAGTKALEFVNFDGTGRNRLIADGLQHPFGIDIYDRYVFISDWDLQSVIMADKNTGRERKSIITETSDLMDIRVFHRNRKNIRNPCGKNNGGCSHMCLLSPLEEIPSSSIPSTRCACPIGVKLTGDNKTCKDGPSSYIIFAHRTDIRQISLDIDYMIDVVLPLSQISNVYAVDVDIVTGDIYWADNIEDLIMRSSADGQNVQQILSESMDSVDGMVICSISRKIYFTDAGRRSIEVSELDGSHRKVLVWQDLESPRAIAIDYEMGYLFFSDWGTLPRIERSDMDGERRSRIITTELGWPNGLAVDKQRKNLYWTDAKLHHIKMCDFDGNFHQTIVEFRNEEHPYGIAVTKTKIYYTDWKTNALHSVNKNNLTARTIITGNLEGLMDVKVVNTNERLEVNSCGNNNGGCSHLCLRKPKGYSCQCPTGLKMREDGKNCEDLPNSYLLIALRSGIGRISLDTPEMFDVVLPIDGVHGAVVVDYHHAKNYLFYADVNADAIKRVNMKNDNDIKTIISTGLNTPNGLCVDWIANNLYWSDSALKMIEVSRLDGNYRKTLLRTDLDDVRSMIVYKHMLFFADWGHSARIERSLLDGSDRKVVVNSDLGFPTGLAIDFLARKLFWADALHDRVEMSDFDGKHRKRVIDHAEHPFGFTLTNSYFYYSDWFNKSIMRVARHQNANAEEVRHNLRGALEIRSVSAERQPNYFNPCNESNGGCDFLCLYLGGKRYVCECPNYIDRPCKREIKESSMKPPDSDETTLTTILKNEDLYPVQQRSSESSILIASIIIITALLVIVVSAIIFLVCHSKKKEKNKRLTFSNPNYNGAGYNDEPGKSTFFKRFKYDKAQDRVYEEKVLNCGQETASSTMMSSGNPSPMPSHSAILSTIG